MGGRGGKGESSVREYIQGQRRRKRGNRVRQKKRRDYMSFDVRDAFCLQLLLGEGGEGGEGREECVFAWNDVLFSCENINKVVATQGN